jgi:hypothetical protein
MSIINSQPLIGASGNQGVAGYNLTKSLRFRSSASAYLGRTPASAGNRKTWTWSGWVKLGKLSTYQLLLSAGTNSNGISFESDGTLAVDGFYDGTRAYRNTSNAVWRDPSAWYHIVVALDTTQATDTNRIKLYVNGTQVTLSGAYVGTWPAQNSDGVINNNVAHSIGRRQNIPDAYFDGYLAETNFIDGQALTPSSFGETDSITGVWKPKRYTGSYGTNGFYLPFTDVATTSGSNAGLGKDFSGNGNYWTTNNISVTAGSTYDSMTDVPTLTSATAANYAVCNPLGNTIGTTSTLSNGNLTASASGNTWWNSTISLPSSGKWYFEYTPTGVSANAPWIGISSNSTDYSFYQSSGAIYINGSSVTTVATYTDNDVIACAYDVSGTIYFYKNNTLVYSGALTFKNNMFFTGFVTTGNAVGVNFGQQGFKYTPPTGFVALNTYNLPDSTIVAGNKVMDATTYTGNATASTNITNAASFKPDFVWIKNRTNVTNHILTDSVRGTTKTLFSDATSIEATVTGGLTAFNSNGFQIGFDGSNIVNNTSNNYVGWQWQAGQGSTSSNTAGSITSTVSVNASAGFSVVTYTAPSSGAFTVGHGLGVAPAMIITKSRSNAYSWGTYHQSIGNTGRVDLNTTSSITTSVNSAWNNTSPTSTVFSMGLDWAGSGITYVAYCWSEIAGFSKFGSYTGNGSTDGTFVYTGFRPKFVIIKRTDTTSQWSIWDSSRNTSNAANSNLWSDSSEVETTASAYDIDFLSNGIKFRNSNAARNASGGTYIYMAFAENPFKNSLAR